ncbi:MAG: WecB/TagA/CpsF family glycosyltransferase [Oculatellaceae cyanobacterium Prado106]|jgi:N-acetylglucosaminyldiphosphoundecaprenol N-acetyl-beta-D-mannosaminyltransferase|nr:WecB/TagA/CpsF family glycosyltransferase [Oculatellaceae cyanobacterium Prado106]
MQGTLHNLPDHPSVMGLPIHLLSDYTGWLLTQLRQGQGVHVVTLNAEMAMQAEQNADLAAVIHRAELVIPDGAGVVFYLKLRGQSVQRCPGIELAEKLLSQSAQLETPCPVFFYGGAPGVCEAAAEVWQQRVQGMAIAGTQHGYLSAEEQPQFRQTLQQLQPRIILVGLGVPRQEFWIAEHRHLCPNAIWIGVGGSFDIWAGTKTRAPGWLRNNNLEWVYRLYQEPWRWRRMMALPKFALKALAKQN